MFCRQCIINLTLLDCQLCTVVITYVHTHTHTHARACTHAHTRVRARTHAPTQNIKLKFVGSTTMYHYVGLICTDHYIHT